MEIYFLRHGDYGKAGGGMADAERPLSEVGEAAMKQEAVTLASLHLGLDMIVTSPFLRARQSAEIMAREVRLLQALAVDDRLAPGFGYEALKEVLADHRASHALMLVGHEPDFSRTIAACIGGGRVECKKGALVRVDLDDPETLSGTLVWLIPPRVLAP